MPLTDQTTDTIPAEMQRYHELEAYLVAYTAKIREIQAEYQKSLDKLIPDTDRLAQLIAELKKKPGTESVVKDAQTKLAIGEMRIRNYRQIIQNHEQDLRRESNSIRNEQQQLLRALTPVIAIGA